jgi:trk system potassium uptake protein TrkH
MNKRAVFHLVSYMTLFIGLAITACAAVSHVCGDALEVRCAFLLAGGITLAVSLVAGMLTRGDLNLGRRDGFGVVTLGWLSAALFGALPYLLTGVITHPVSALFETVSGFTTTGASVLDNLESLPRGILFWRALTHWLGGMGVLVLCVAILPFLGVGGMQLYRAEMPGPFKDRLTPHIATTAKLLWAVYLLLTVAQTVLLKGVGGMGWFDSVCHSFATVATGGFSTRTASVAAYDSATVEGIITLFMFLAGINFSLHLSALTGRPGHYVRDPECRAYFLFLTGCCLFMTANIWATGHGSFARCLRDAFFTGTSVLTSTGFCTVDFDRWPGASRLLLVFMMLMGACAGSTGGGIKVVRIMIVFKKILREIRLFMRPTAAIQVKLGPKPVEPDLVLHVSAFVIIYFAVFAMGSFLMTFFTPDLETATTSVITALSNVGPGLSAVGPVRNYASIPLAGQGVLATCMLLGRLELYTVLVLLFPSCWRR